MKNINIFSSEDWVEYELLDTGNKQKLERFGDYTFIRPYEEAIWQKNLNKKEWDKAHAIFLGGKNGEKSSWKIINKLPKDWIISYKGIKFKVYPTSFRHLGVFPEQAVHWDFIEKKIKESKKPFKFLNLFGYTGVASLFALRARAEVTHLDSSKNTLEWAKENQKISNLEDLPIRIIQEDVIKFLEREIKRGNKYDGIILDPPKFGRGPKGEIWKIEEKLFFLLEAIKKVLSNNPSFVILTSYNTDSSSLTLQNQISEAFKTLKGQTTSGELCLKEKSTGKIISLANTVIWEKI